MYIRPFKHSCTYRRSNSLGSIVFEICQNNLEGVLSVGAKLLDLGTKKNFVMQVRSFKHVCIEGRIL